MFQKKEGRRLTRRNEGRHLLHPNIQARHRRNSYQPGQHWK